MFFHKREIKREWKDAAELADWVGTHTKPGDEIAVINDGPGDDAMILEVWIGGCPEGRTEHVRKLSKKKGGPA